MRGAPGIRVQGQSEPRRPVYARAPFWGGIGTMPVPPPGAAGRALRAAGSRVRGLFFQLAEILLALSFGDLYLSIYG